MTLAHVQPDEIRLRAYQLWEQSGRTAGHDLEHWLQAEQELAVALEVVPAAPVAARPRRARSAAAARPRTPRQPDAAPTADTPLHG
jgi:hypothetical protein